MKRSLIILASLAIFLAACGSGGAPAASGGSGATSAPGVATVAPQATFASASQQAVTALATQLSIPASQITVVSSDAVTWPDDCLGIQRQDIICTVGQIPGFRIMMQANGKTYEYHTNHDGSALIDATGRATEIP